MKKLLFLSISAITLITSCSSEPPVKITTGEACEDQYFEKRVEIEGELYTPESFITVTAMQMILLTEGADAAIMISFRPGDCTNCMESLPDNYSDADVVIHGDDDNIIGAHDKVRVIGEMVATTEKSGYCQLDVETIVKL